MQPAIYFKFTWTYHHTQGEASGLDLVWNIIKQFMLWSLCTLQSAKKVSFTAFPLGKLWQASTNLKLIFTSLKKFWMSKINTVKPLLSGHLQDLPKCLLNRGVRLIRVVKIVQCLLMINIQRLLCTVIKLHVVKEAIQSSSSLPFITNLNLFVNAKTLTDLTVCISRM